MRFLFYISFTVKISRQIKNIKSLFYQTLDIAGASEGIRTPGQLVRSQLLYPTELLTHIIINITDFITLHKEMQIKFLSSLRHQHNYKTIFLFILKLRIR